VPGVGVFVGATVDMGVAVGTTCATVAVGDKVTLPLLTVFSVVFVYPFLIVLGNTNPNTRTPIRSNTLIMLTGSINLGPLRDGVGCTGIL